jgi:hypothetical protein
VSPRHPFAPFALFRGYSDARAFLMSAFRPCRWSNKRCSEPGHRITVAIVASRGPG